MTRVNLTEAQRRLPELLAAAEQGETIEIHTSAGRAVRLIVEPVPPSINPAWPGFPHPGSAAGLIDIPEDFDAPIDELKEYME